MQTHTDSLLSLMVDHAADPPDNVSRVCVCVCVCARACVRVRMNPEGNTDRINELMLSYDGRDPISPTDQVAHIDCLRRKT